jgi:hypothetical protein
MSNSPLANPQAYSAIVQPTVLTGTVNAIPNTGAGLAVFQISGASSSAQLPTPVGNFSYYEFQQTDLLSSSNQSTITMAIGTVANMPGTPTTLTLTPGQIVRFNSDQTNWRVS